MPKKMLTNFTKLLVATIMLMSISSAVAEKGGKFDRRVTPLTAAFGWSESDVAFGQVLIFLNGVDIIGTFTFDLNVQNLRCRGKALGAAAHAVEANRYYQFYINGEAFFSFNTKCIFVDGGGHAHAGSSLGHFATQMSVFGLSAGDLSFDPAVDDLLFEIYMEPDHVLAMEGFLEN